MKKFMSIAAAFVLCASVLTVSAMPVQKDSAKAKTHKMHKSGAHKGMKKDTSKKGKM